MNGPKYQLYSALFCRTPCCRFIVVLTSFRFKQGVLVCVPDVLKFCLLQPCTAASAVLLVDRSPGLGYDEAKDRCREGFPEDVNEL